MKCKKTITGKHLFMAVDVSISDVAKWISVKLIKCLACGIFDDRQINKIK